MTAAVIHVELYNAATNMNHTETTNITSPHDETPALCKRANLRESSKSVRFRHLAFSVDGFASIALLSVVFLPTVAASHRNRQRHFQLSLGSPLGPPPPVDDGPIPPTACRAPAARLPPPFARCFLGVHVRNLKVTALTSDCQIGINPDCSRRLPRWLRHRLIRVYHPCCPRDRPLLGLRWHRWWLISRALLHAVAKRAACLSSSRLVVQCSKWALPEVFSRGMLLEPCWTGLLLRGCFAEMGRSTRTPAPYCAVLYSTVVLAGDNSPPAVIVYSS